MATKAGGAYIEIRGEDRRLQGDLDGAHRKIDRFANQMQTSVSKAFKVISVAALAAGTVAVYQIQKVGREAIKAASDLEEVSSKFNVVFAGQQNRVEQWSKALVDGYAMSTREAKQYLSSVQDLLVPMGMEARQAANLSNEIVKLSADLGSFNNLPTAKVMEDIQSALVGNYETMKKYGVVLNATVVQEKALSMGLASTKNELTAGMKAQASYALMVQGSTAAIGDMARTSEGYANQVKKMESNIEDLKAMLGKEFLPEVTAVVIQMNAWFNANDGLIKQKTHEAIYDIKESIKDIGHVVKITSSFISEFKDGLLAVGITIAAFKLGSFVAAWVTAAKVMATASVALNLFKIALVSPTMALGLLAFAANPVVLAVTAISAALGGTYYAYKKFMKSNDDAIKKMAAFQREADNMDMTHLESEIDSLTRTLANYEKGTGRTGFWAGLFGTDVKHEYTKLQIEEMLIGLTNRLAILRTEREKARTAKILKDSLETSPLARGKATKDYSQLAKLSKQAGYYPMPWGADLYEKQLEEINAITLTAGDKIWEIEQQQNNERLAALQDFNTQYNERGKSRFDLEREQLEAQKAIWEKYNFDKDKRDQLYANRSIKIAQEESQAKTAIYAQSAGMIADTFLQIAQAGGQQSEKAFRVYQAFAITEAIIAANLAAAKVLGQTGIFGIPLSALVYGQAMMNVAMIAAAKPPSYETGTDYVPQTGLALLHQGERVIPKSQNKGGGGNTFIIKMENPVFQDLDTQRRAFAQIATVIAKRVAPGAIVQDYDNDGYTRTVIRGRR